MAHTWTTGEVITADNLNSLENTATDALNASNQLETVIDNFKSTVNSDVEDIKTTVDELESKLGDDNIEEFLKQLLENIYPVGHVIISVDKNYDPNDVLFGTWQRMDDYYLRSASDINEVGKVAGSDTFTLTEDNMPEHYHSVKMQAIMYSEGSKVKTIIGNTDTTQNTTSAGKGTVVTHLPRYISVSAWKRTA